MAAEPLEIRMARLEGVGEQINERLGALERRLASEIGALRSEIKSEIGSVRSEIGSVRAEIFELRRQTNGQFYWLLTLILGSILIPILRDLAR